VALGRALIKEPDLLLFDEPLSNLDAELRLHMRAEIKRLQRSLGITAVLVTHGQTEALSMADRLLVYARGGCNSSLTRIHCIMRRTIRLWRVSLAVLR
jgi:ABC-type sugar transport system ATPase subunit